MNVLLVRVGTDRSEGGGLWNGPVDSLTGEFPWACGVLGGPEGL